MPITSAPVIRPVRLVRLGALLAVAAVPLLWATPASAGPHPVPGVATVRLTALSPATLPTSAVSTVGPGATPPDEAGRCRSEAAALALALRDAEMSAQGGSYAGYVLAEECGLHTTAAAAEDAASGPAGAAAVRTWNSIAVTTVVAAATPVVEQPLHVAAAQRAVYDAVARTHGKGRRASVIAAVASAAHAVLVAEFPAQRATLDRDLADSLATVLDIQALAAGSAIGTAAGQAALAERVADGRDGPVKPVPPPGPGAWIPTPPNIAGVSSWLGDVRPFVLRSADAVRPAGPPALGSARWARDYNETRLMGSATSTERTPAQTEVARFWADPPIVQNQRALRGYTEGHVLSVEDTAQVLALADTASADALIACFDAKYRVQFWRPFSAIPAGETDGNPATPADPAWRSLLPTPNFPEYPSAHSCSTTAIATVVAGLAPGHRLDLTMDSTTTGTVHHFTTVSQLTREVADARVWGGLHWRFSTEDGTRLGRTVGLAVLAAADND